MQVKIYAILVCLLAIISLQLPVWCNGKFASILSIIYTIICDVLKCDINTFSIGVFLLPLFLFYFFILRKKDNNLFFWIFSIIVLIVIIPVLSMLPPR